MFPPKKGQFPGPKPKTPLMSEDALDQGSQLGDQMNPVPQPKGVPPPPSVGGDGSKRGPRKFRRTGLTRVDHDSFPE